MLKIYYLPISRSLCSLLDILPFIKYTYAKKYAISEYETYTVQKYILNFSKKIDPGLQMDFKLYV